MSVNIQLEWTPNPSTLKYVVDAQLIPRGAMNFTTREVANERSPLASRLFDIKGVTAVMLGTNFVTVTKGDEGEWDELNDGVMLTLDQHLSANETVVRPEVLEELSRVSRGKMLEDGAISEIVRAISELPTPQAKIRRVQLWSHPLVAATLITMLGFFWVWRKAVGLI